MACGMCTLWPCLVRPSAGGPSPKARASLPHGVPRGAIVCLPLGSQPSLMLQGSAHFPAVQSLHPPLSCH